MKSPVVFAALSLCLGLSAGAARADEAAPPRILVPPAGWISDSSHAQLVQHGMETDLPQGPQASVEVYSYHPTERGAQLIASLVTVQVSGDAAGAWVRERIDGIQETPALMGGDGGKVRTISWAEKSDDATKVVEANLQWANDDDQTVAVVRALWVKRAHPAGAPDVIEEYRGECVMSADAAATLQPPCVAALAQLQLPAIGDRLAIAPPAKIAEPDEGDDEPAQPPEATPATPTTTPATTEPTTAAGAEIHKTPDGVAPIVDRRQPSNEGRDLRPFWVGGGLLLVIGVLLWSRKKRQELLAEEERREKEDAAAKAGKSKGKGKPEPEPEPEAKAAPDEPADDADAGDLADAAGKDDA